MESLWLSMNGDEDSVQSKIIQTLRIIEQV